MYYAFDYIPRSFQLELQVSKDTAVLHHTCTVQYSSFHIVLCLSLDRLLAHCHVDPSRYDRQPQCKMVPCRQYLKINLSAICSTPLHPSDSGGRR